MGSHEEIHRQLEEAMRSRPDLSVSEIVFSLLDERQTRSFVAMANAVRVELPFDCERTADADAREVVPESERMSCQFCGEEVWMSPAACRAFRRIAWAFIVCSRCARRPMRRAEFVKATGPGPGRDG